ncbi:hypothetical protein AAVH_19248 [Aphelenchoides avenae]|nr:hypothetical protein AAVH_19248 [Aphelenchus avenae]
MTNTSLGGYGYYQGGGIWANQTVETATKEQVKDGINYQCDADLSAPKMIFNGTWYCYYMATAPASYDTIANNYCDTLNAGSTVVKVLSYREYRYLYYRDTSVTQYTGLVRINGTTT